jgi:ABC-type transport system involved in multi-copper enzyme maturation permease subunit
MATLTIARMVLVEASRRRLLLALAVLTLAVIGVLGYGFGQLPRLAHGATQDDIRQAASFLQIFAFFMFSFVLSFAAVFTAAPAIAGDLESGVLLAIVPRPIRRSEIVLGRWLGLCAVVAVYTVAATVLEMLVVWAVVGYLPPGPAGAVAFLVFEGVVAVTLGLALSTRFAPMTAGIVATVLLLVVWFGGIIGNVGFAFGNDAITLIGVVARLALPTDGMWRGALYFLQTPEFLAAQQLLGRRAYFFPFFAGDPPPAPYLVWVAAWVAGMLGLTIASFRNREL